MSNSHNIYESLENKRKDKALKKNLKIEKGHNGYINSHKVKQLLYTFISLLGIAIIFYTGIIRYNNTKNIFTVIAAVAAIPTAKIAVSYIILIPYKSIARDMMLELSKGISKEDLLFELLISSPEKIINIEAAFIRDNSVYCLMISKKVEAKFVEKYIREFLESEAKVTSVKIFDNQEAFAKSIRNLEHNEKGKFDETIKKLLLIYSL